MAATSLLALWRRRPQGCHAQRSGDDRGVRGGAALTGDDGDDLTGVEGGRVGRGEVGRGQDEGVTEAAYPWRRPTGQDRHDAAARICDVARALGHVAAE